MHRLPFLHAKSFLYALDTILKTLGRLTQINGVPSQVRVYLADYNLAFPSLKEVRNSAHHVEDRIQGKAHNSKIVPKPVQNAAINAAEGGVLVTDMLNGSRYGGTLADGSFGEVEVSEASLAEAARLVQRVLDDFNWMGPGQLSPS